MAKPLSLLKNQGFTLLVLIIIISVILIAASASYMLINNKPENNTGIAAKKPTITTLISNRQVLGDFNDGVENQLKQLGYENGKNLNYQLIEISNADPQFEQKIQDVINSNPDIIIAFTGELIVPVYNWENKLKKQIPFVAAAGFDLRDIGVTDFKGSKTFVAGVVGNTQQISQKRLAVAKQALPNLKTVGMIANPKQPTYLGSIEPFKEAASSLGLKAVEYKVTSQEELDKTLAGLKKTDVDLLMTSGQAIIIKNVDKIFNTATAKGIPTLDFRPNTTEKVLLNYAHSYYSIGEGAANQAHKILKGQSPGDLPLDEPKKVIFTLNLKIANQLGITIPNEVISSADKVIR